MQSHTYYTSEHIMCHFLVTTNAWEAYIIFHVIFNELFFSTKTNDGPMGFEFKYMFFCGNSKPVHSPAF